MKLRTNKNSIRFRLSQSEVDEFKKFGVVHECICFSVMPNQQLDYSLVQYDQDAISISYLNNHLRVYVPVSIADHWCNSNEIGMDCKIVLHDKNELSVLIEKDFKCLVERSSEDESDNFPNPNAAC
jgi:hypothetical protein